MGTGKRKSVSSLAVTAGDRSSHMSLPRASSKASVSKPPCTLMIFSDGELSGEVGTLPSVGNQMKPSWVQFPATEAVTKVRGDLGADRWSLRMSSWDYGAFGW